MCHWVSPDCQAGLQAQVPHVAPHEPQQGRVATLALGAEEVRALHEAP